jgi:hypothetical protein
MMKGAHLPTAALGQLTKDSFRNRQCLEVGEFTVSERLVEVLVVNNPEIWLLTQKFIHC